MTDIAMVWTANLRIFPNVTALVVKPFLIFHLRSPCLLVNFLRLYVLFHNRTVILTVKRYFEKWRKKVKLLTKSVSFAALAMASIKKTLDGRYDEIGLFHPSFYSIPGNGYRLLQLLIKSPFWKQSCCCGSYYVPIDEIQAFIKKPLRPPAWNSYYRKKIEDLDRSSTL